LGSDVAALAELCHARGVYLIIDEAHGGLWPFSKQLPTSATQLGTDVVIHSMHKSGGSLTQSALAHLPHGSRIDPAVFQQALNTLQTTSPSYLLMSSLEATCHVLASHEGQQRLESHLERTRAFRARLSAGLSQLKLFEPQAEPKTAQAKAWDPTKLYLTHPSESGEDWGARLEAERGISYESASPDGVLYLANLGLADEDLLALESELLAEDHAIQQANESNSENAESRQPAQALPDPAVLIPEMAMNPREAFFAPGEHCSPSQAVGRIAKETIVHCPPGIPMLFPGERILPAHVPLLPEDGLLVVSDPDTRRLLSSSYRG